MTATDWQQLTIVHLSDLHFGDQHSFNPPGGGDPAGQPSLGESLLQDLQTGNFALPTEFPQFLPSLRSADETVPAPTRVILAITGDFNERSNEPEFKQARDFLKEFYSKSIFNFSLSPDDIFMVPGNHDLKYAEPSNEDRWYKYCNFYSDHNALRTLPPGAQASIFRADKPTHLTRVIDQSDRGLIIAEINSSAYVQKATPDERRGQIDQEAIVRLKNSLAAIPKSQKQAAIKIALVHHHPVVLPALAERENGYDAILNSDFLLSVLKQHGFHMILHGHKHNPYTFSYDAVCAWFRDPVQPLLIVAGGSAGSQALPVEKGATNTYNVISIKWHAAAAQARIHIETRGLQVHDPDTNMKLPAPQWSWQTLRVDDRLLTASRRTSPSTASLRARSATDQKYDDLRSETLKLTRRNFAAIEVFPSLDGRQGYEARVWIEGQLHADYMPPIKVEWSSNPQNFREVYVCNAESDPEFRARFSYYGPTLIQARLFWEDGYEAQTYIYARIPNSERL